MRMNTTRQLGLSIRPTYFWVAFVLSSLVCVAWYCYVDGWTVGRWAYCRLFYAIMYNVSSLSIRYEQKFCVWWFSTWFK